MSIYSSAVKRPLTTLLLFIAVVILGVYSLRDIPIDLYPEVEMPAVSVYTMYPGANASDIEQNVTKIIEDQLNTVDGLKEISSTSSDNVSLITLEFEWGTDLTEAVNDVRDALAFAERLLPEDCEDPSIFKFNSAMMPILFYTVTADESYAGIEKIIDEQIVNPLNRIEGIGQIGISGGPKREVMIDIDPVKMEAYNVSIEMIGAIIQAENLNMPAGNVKMGSMDYPLRIEGEFTESSELNSIVVGSYEGKDIRLGDVATINDSIAEMTIDERINGDLGIRMFVQKQSGANTVQVANDVKARIAELEKELPEDIKIECLFDTSEFIEGSISNLTQTLMFAIIFVVLIVLLFLGRWRATLIVATSIPISLLVAFIYIRMSGGSINVISLASLSIAIGMVVDDAIVVLENIIKHIDNGASPRQAAIYATNEVWVAVIVTTLAVAAVFLPLTLVSGFTGVLFKQLGWIVSITIATSTITAITLIPMLSSRLLKKKDQKKKKKERKLSYNNTVIKALDRLDRGYSKAITAVLKRKWITLISAALIFFASLALVPGIGMDFMPEADQSNLSANIELQTGLRVEETIILARELDSIIEEVVPEATLISTAAGNDENGGFAALFNTSGTNIINYSIDLVDISDRDRDVWEIAEVLRAEFVKIPEIINYSVSTSSGFGSMGASNTVDIDIYGYDITETNLIAEEISTKIENVKGARDIAISRDKSKPELQVVLDQDKMSEHNINTYTVANTVRNRVEGLTASIFRENGEEYDIVIRFDEEGRNSITDIENISIMNQQGQMIKLREIGEVIEYWSPPSIDRKRKERLVTVSVKAEGVSLGELAGAINKELATVDVPSNIMIEVGGAFEDQQESQKDLMTLMMISLLLVYIVMASQFESLKMPIIIMTSIPFSFTGVLLALSITNTTLSTIALLGAILLIGIVVKNAIVLVDYINLMRDRGLELNEAIITACKSRLRPVLMTSLTTILSMLPLALSVGEGAEIWSPMGIAVTGGLIFSTILTLFVVPAFYAAMSRSGARNKKKKLRKSFVFMDDDNNNQEIENI